MSNDKIIRVACIGLGWVSLHRHFPSIKRHPNLKLVGVIDRYPGQAAAIAKKYKLPYYAETEDLTKVPWLENVDAVIIATAPMAHAELAMTAMALGKHVLTEKPFAMSVEEGVAMCAAARQYDRILAVVHNFQFSRAANKLMHDLATGKLGKIKRITAVQLGNPHRRLPSWFEKLPLGLFYDESPHFFYLLHRLSGGHLKLQHAHGIASANNHNTPAAVSLLYRNEYNTPITINCQFDSTISEWYVMIAGKDYLGIIDIFRDIYMRIPNDGVHGPRQILCTSISAIWQHIIQHIPNGIAYMFNRLDYGNDAVFDTFANAVKSGIQPDAIGCDRALSVLKLQHEAIEALERNMYK
ncbi:MAG: Gfo/Idh/MocA family oxidoreductase [Alphaproteobacteria bacterium]|nr:Gfo/Idh/MocA family oxidoreductase [Alphaproteobacteria bacterium]